MSRKHNTKHMERGTSNYPLRPGMYRTHRPPTMPTLDSLRALHERRIKATGVPWPTVHDGEVNAIIETGNDPSAEALLREIFEAA